MSLKSQQILTETLSCLSSGTICAAQSANWADSMISSATNLSSTFFSKGSMEYGKERALQNQGETPAKM